MFLCFKEDGDSLVVRTDFDQREAMISEDPDVYYITDHYLKYPLGPRPPLPRASGRNPRPHPQRASNRWCLGQETASRQTQAQALAAHNGLVAGPRVRFKL